VIWDGWTTSGHRELHGVQEEETVIGYQLICKPCEAQFSRTKGSSDKGSFCFATTNPIFWKNWEHWAIPCESITLIPTKLLRILTMNTMQFAAGVPYFFKRCAVTHELFNMIIEICPSSTSMGLAENIKRTIFNLIINLTKFS
jgi:hypothetical protein